jgi:hypothetical protein
MGIMQGVKMANGCKDFRSWHLENLKDHTQAAYYMLAALEDAMENDRPAHFIRATYDVAKANAIPKDEIFPFFIAHLKASDREIVNELVGRLVVKLMVEKLTAADLEFA